MPDVVDIVGVQENARSIAHSRDRRLHFVALHFLVEEIQRRGPEEDRQKEKENGVASEVFPMDHFHQNVVDQIDRQIAEKDEEKMVGKRFGLDDGTVQGEGDVQTIGRNENQHAIQVARTREETILSQQSIQIHLNDRERHISNLSSEQHSRELERSLSIDPCSRSSR